MDILQKPKDLDQEETSKALGKLMWGKEGGKFSMGRLIKNLMKKRILKGRK